MKVKDFLNSSGSVNKKKPESKDEQFVYDENYLKGLRKKAKKSWQGIGNPDEWLRNLRQGEL